MKAKLEPRTGGQPSRFAHDHPRCDSCRATEEAWQTCIVSLHRDREYVKRLESECAYLQDQFVEIYHALPSRRTKLAKRVLALATKPFGARNGEQAT